MVTAEPVDDRLGRLRSTHPAARGRYVRTRIKALAFAVGGVLLMALLIAYPGIVVGRLLALALIPTIAGVLLRRVSCPPRPLTSVLLAAAVTAVVASCSSNESATDRIAASTSAPSTPTVSSTPASPASSPTPSLAPPADGDNFRACADGTCEIRVTTPVTVPLPARFGLGPIEVTAINAQTVTMVAPLLQPEFSSDGGCESTFTGPAANSSAYVSLTCHTGDKAVINELNLQAVGVTDQAAIIRIRPAA